MTGRSRYLISRVAVVALSVAWTVAVNALVATPVARAALLAVAVPDTATATQNVQLSVAAPGVLGNDLNLLGASQAVLMTGAGHGNVSLSTNGSYRYTSDGGFTGTDTFRYRIEGGLLGPSNTTTVTITVKAPPPTPTPVPTPTPTPKPTPSPTPTPKPTATPTPTAAPTATPRPTPPPTPRPTGLPTLPPLPTLSPLPTTLLPTATPRPTATSTARPTLTPSPSPTPAGAGAGSPGTPSGASGGGSGTGGTSTGGGPGTPNASSRPAGDGPFTIAGGSGSTVQLDASNVTFSSFEWAVPALVLSVPGLFLVLAVAVEALIGLAWLPVARRWVGDDETQRRRRRRRLSAI